MSRLSQTMTSSFLSTPSARRATSFSFSNLLRSRISIHALREEGDPECRFLQDAVEAFLSTPSARRATSEQFARLTAQKISIHALREEGDPAPAIWQPLPRYFYPRPPRGGRHRQAGVFIFLF